MRPSFHVFVDEGQHRGVRRANIIGSATTQPVLAALDGDQPVSDTVLLELAHHNEALLVRYIGVFRTVDHQCRRISGGSA